MAAVALLGIGAGVGALITRRNASDPAPAGSAVTVLRPAASVLTKVRDLERLESVSFHMERVIDLTEKQSRLFGLIEAEDAILLVAAADVRAGIDLSRLVVGDIEVDPIAKKARIWLPPAEILSASLDAERTYVHTRKTGIAARRREDLETRARKEAERTLEQAAREAGILARAEQNAIRTVAGLVTSLGYEEVDVAVRRVKEK